MWLNDEQDTKLPNTPHIHLPRENSKLIGLSPIFLSIMVASNNAPNSRKLSLSSALSWTQKHLHVFISLKFAQYSFCTTYMEKVIIHLETRRFPEFFSEVIHEGPGRSAWKNMKPGFNFQAHVPLYRKIDEKWHCTNGKTCIYTF